MVADPVQILRQMQLHKTIGELKALESTYYNPMEGRTDEYTEIQEVIRHIIKELKDYMG